MINKTNHLKEVSFFNKFCSQDSSGANSPQHSSGQTVKVPLMRSNGAHNNVFALSIQNLNCHLFFFHSDWISTEGVLGRL